MGKIKRGKTNIQAIYLSTNYHLYYSKVWGIKNKSKENGRKNKTNSREPDIIVCGVVSPPLSYISHILLKSIANG